MILKTIRHAITYGWFVLPKSLGVTLMLGVIGTTGSLLMDKRTWAGSLTDNIFIIMFQGMPGLFCTVGFAGGIFLHQYFQRGQEIFWWNLGVPLPWRVGGAWGLHVLGSFIGALVLWRF